MILFLFKSMSVGDMRTCVQVCVDPEASSLPGSGDTDHSEPLDI